MFTDQDFIRRSPNAAGEDSKNEYLVLDLSNGNYFGIDEVGRFIWQQLDGKTPLEAIARSIADRYKIETNQALQDLREFLSELDERELIELMR